MVRMPAHCGSLQVFNGKKVQDPQPHLLCAPDDCAQDEALRALNKMRALLSNSARILLRILSPG
ncbi:hypothetical protein DUNSADRAFT_11831 [Dunaliella salina]|uniref:Encoded protein n=1 Tax=Dunaliella salina TaxID=3046 RepID=A0ABQ7GCG8_DUNSA|nr:hypothetical protein DUNSADRAFT_11831 [Dunaliella salina]|eukprot:KAF5832294.1 hypothetical protein DUNSADRAFT_11831 [Dunaliella salina]